MNKQAKSYWNEHYERHRFAGGKAPAPFLQRMLPRLQKGRVLDIAMGEGANAVYLAQQGCAVEGFDISEVACQRATELARDTGVELKVKCTDVDLYLFGIMQYDTIVMSFFKPAVLRYYPEIIKALKQGGTLLMESYLVGAMPAAIVREESYRNFYFNSNEFLPHLKGMQLLYYSETKIDGKACVQCFARKPVDRDAVKYNLFDMHTAEEPHPASRQLELAEKLFKKN